MSRTKAKLAKEHERAVRWKEQHRLLKLRYTVLKEKIALLKKESVKCETPPVPLEVTKSDTEESSITFVKECYMAALGRAPLEEELRHPDGYAAMLVAGKWTRLQILTTILQGQEFRERHVNLEFVPAGHFYSAVPSPEDRARAIQRRDAQEGAGIDMRPEAQKQLLQMFASYLPDCPCVASDTPEYRYCFQNDTFAWFDGYLLYGMMRHFKPKRIIEIGSGCSSALMLDMSGHPAGCDAELTFVDPYAAKLRSLMKPGDEARTKIIEQPVQSIDLSVFRELQANDILFIDSTHVTKCGSDVNFLYFEVLPVLNKGVIVHIHDIFYPWEYPLAWITAGHAWNELYLLHAFLMHNDKYQVLVAGSYAQQQLAPVMQEYLPRFATYSAGSFWMQKK